MFKTIENNNNQFYEISSFIEILFQKSIYLLPSVTELFELELAFLEYNVLPEHKLLDRTAYIQALNGNFSKHFLLYNNGPEFLTKDRTAKTRKYFENGVFSTGYATHGLFPYRGKFHPQLIKALINIIGLEKGDILLDPMCGSGTANIEASMMGINSFAIDISPFCQLMTQAKYEALRIPKDFIILLSKKHKELFKFFSRKNILKVLNKIENNEKQKLYRLALLAYLDAMGYSKRVSSSTHQELFERVLTRYQNTALQILNNPYFNNSELGKLCILPNSNALKLEIENNSIDGVITSPPYSFAIDYAKNDEPQLEYLGYNVSELKSRMIGLNGKSKSERLQNYFNDMTQVCSEIYRVLKKGKYFIIIIGSNTNQTGGIRLEGEIISQCENIGFNLVKSLLKPIKGIRNTMKEEYILFFKKN